MQSVRTACRWLPPSPEFIKINFDGAIFNYESKSGMGAVIRDESGLILASCSKKLNHAYSAIEIEALAAAMALSLAMEIGIKSAVLD